MNMKEEALRIMKDTKIVWFAAAALMLVLILASDGCSQKSSEAKEATLTVAAMGDVIDTELTLRRWWALDELSAIQAALQVPDSECSESSG